MVAGWYTGDRMSFTTTDNTSDPCCNCGTYGQHICPLWSSPSELYKNWANPIIQIDSLCEQIRKDRKMSTIPSYAPSEDIQYLDDARASRDSAKRHMQRLNDAAKLHMIEADALRARALMLVDELNEEVPTPADD